MVTLIVSFGATRAHAAAPSGGGRWLLTTTPLVASGHGTRDTRVWLPPSYDSRASAGRRFPVVVFLHGWPGSAGNWPVQGRAGETLGALVALVAAGRIPEVIGLFPDGSGSGTLGRSLWLDSWNGRARLDSLGVGHTYAEYSHGHDWDYWRAHLVQSLEAVTNGMR